MLPRSKHLLFHDLLGDCQQNNSVDLLGKFCLKLPHFYTFKMSSYCTSTQLRYRCNDHYLPQLNVLHLKLEIEFTLLQYLIVGGKYNLTLNKLLLKDFLHILVDIYVNNYGKICPAPKLLRLSDIQGQSLHRGQN